MKEWWRKVPLLVVSGMLLCLCAWWMKEQHERVEVVAHEIHLLRQENQSDTSERVIYLKILFKKRDIDRKLARTLAAAIHRHAVKTQRDPDFILALALKESDLQPESVSPVGAIGLIQVMPQWVKVFGDDCNLKDLDCNLRQGLRLLGVYEDLYGSLELALVAYNRGPNPVDWALKKNQNPDNGYATDVLELYNELKEL
jgi:membrane-bound lytic murein transglycosylase MltF